VRNTYITTSVDGAIRFAGALKVIASQQQTTDTKRRYVHVHPPGASTVQFEGTGGPYLPPGEAGAHDRGRTLPELGRALFASAAEGDVGGAGADALAAVTTPEYPTAQLQLRGSVSRESASRAGDPPRSALSRRRMRPRHMTMEFGGSASAADAPLVADGPLGTSVSRHVAAPPSTHWYVPPATACVRTGGAGSAVAGGTSRAQRAADAAGIKGVEVTGTGLGVHTINESFSTVETADDSDVDVSVGSASSPGSMPSIVRVHPRGVINDTRPRFQYRFSYGVESSPVGVIAASGAAAAPLVTPAGGVVSLPQLSPTKR
jgi:hypothetical protein